MSPTFSGKTIRKNEYPLSNFVNNQFHSHQTEDQNVFITCKVSWATKQKAEGMRYCIGVPEGGESGLMMLVAFVVNGGDPEGLKRGDSGSMDGRERGSIHGGVCEGHGHGDFEVVWQKRPEAGGTEEEK